MTTKAEIRVIQWDGAQWGDRDWVTGPDTGPLALYTAIGFLVAEDAESISIAPNFWDGHMADVVRIPRKNITSLAVVQLDDLGRFKPFLPGQMTAVLATPPEVFG
jgi:hypothetical protein